jgi:hypothetical protein
MLRIAPAFPLSGLAYFLSGNLASQDLCGSKKIERQLAAPVAPRIWRCCELPRRSARLALRPSSVETLRHRTCGSKKIERRLAAPVARILETLLWIAPAFPLSGLACFLSGDLAPQDLWNSKNIEKAAVLSPNLVDYLLLLISNFKVLAMIFNQYTLVSSILYS